MICWFSPISGMASTGTGFRGTRSESQSKGALIQPQSAAINNKIRDTGLLVRKNFIIDDNMTQDNLPVFQ